AGRGVLEARHLFARQHVEAAAGIDAGVDGGKGGVGPGGIRHGFSSCCRHRRFRAPTLAQAGRPAETGGPETETAGALPRPFRVLRGPGDQNLYFRLSMTDQRETAVLMPSPLVSWMPELS